MQWLFGGFGMEFFGDGEFVSIGCGGCHGCGCGCYWGSGWLFGFMLWIFVGMFYIILMDVYIILLGDVLK